MDTYLLGKYLQLIVASFVVCLSVLLMQYTFRYMEELIGKGLETTVILKFFAYASLTMVPMALPLSLLLASLITYGNLGESRELLAMKAAGIPLLRVFRPVFLFVALLSAGSFVFQNSVMPYAVKELAALVWSMKQKNPELDIPEGQFYNAIPGYNLYVENKNPETGMLHEVMIYANPSSPDDAQIVLADSARLQTTADKRHLKLTLFQGERFKNFDSQTGNMLRAESPYMRETFMHEEMLINFDANFDVMSSSQFSHNAQTKPLKEISLGIDSLHARIDSLGRSIYYMQLRGTMRRESNLIGEDSAKLVASLKEAPSLDKAWEELSREDKAAALGRMQNAGAQ
ncbi:MAG: LptF/LptG family permease [Bacteroidaceae bacterium]|nr:LptF/LptG family permease [Bacteroidaceae bacterium]